MGGVLATRRASSQQPGGYLDSSDTYQANTTGAISVLKNLGGAVLNNGDSTGSGAINNFGGAEFVNDDSTVNNQNGSLIGVTGTGTILTNTDGGLINNDSTSTINNEATFENAATVASDGTIKNSGLFQDDGTLKGTGAFTQSAGSTVVNGSFGQRSLTINGGSFTQSGTTTITGNTMNAGTVTILANTMTTVGTFTNSGQVTVGIGAATRAPRAISRPAERRPCMGAPWIPPRSK